MGPLGHPGPAPADRRCPPASTMTTSRMKRGFLGRRNWPCTTDITWQHLQLSGGSRARPPQRHPGGGSAGAAADEDRVTGIESRARHWPHRSRSSASASLLARPLASRRPATRHGIPRPASNRGCPGIAHNEPPSRRTRRLRASLPVILSDPARWPAPCAAWPPSRPRRR